MNESKCPLCQSPSPELHPAVQHEGEVEICRHEWHKHLPDNYEGPAREAVANIHAAAVFQGSK